MPLKKASSIVASTLILFYVYSQSGKLDLQYELRTIWQSKHGKRTEAELFAEQLG